MHVGLLCLIWYGRITEYCSSLSETCKTRLRTWLGPAPQSYRLLADGRVISTTITLQPALLETSYVYDPDSFILQQPQSTARSKRLSWIAVNIDGVDLGNWIQSVRWRGTSEPSLPSLITLWSSIHHHIFPMGTIIHGVKNTAEELNIPYI